MTVTDTISLIIEHIWNIQTFKYPEVQTEQQQMKSSKTDI